MSSWVVHVPYRKGETFTEWRKRFVEERKREPFSLDFQQYDDFIRVDLYEANSQVESSELIKKIRIIIDQNFSQDTVHLTNDLSVWFLNEEDAIVFKLLI